ncbi:MAG: hypothetical protein QNL86_01960 [Crocinitomicaceae bacterium]
MKNPINTTSIPVVKVTDFETIVDPTEVGLSVLVDGRKAFIYEHILDDGFYHREKIVIQFAENHPQWTGGLFQTKYYEFNAPGKLVWGNDRAVMEVEVMT